MIYGYKGTIHASEYVDVGVDSDGHVVSVWFRCMPIPFRQTNVSASRADEMRGMYHGMSARLLAVDVVRGDE